MINQEAIAALQGYLENPLINDKEPFNMAVEALSQPTEYHGTEDMDGLYYCPICQQTTTVVKDGKCPKCGATMDELSTKEQTEDAISRQAALDAFGLSEKTRKYGGDHSGYDTMMLYEIQQTLEDLPSVNPQEQKTGHCKDCKYFEYDSWAKVDGVPLIVAHEICKRWGDGCKTWEDGYCFLFEQQESEE